VLENGASTPFHSGQDLASSRLRGNLVAIDATRARCGR
jgi:hypothetical protein